MAVKEVKSKNGNKSIGGSRLKNNQEDEKNYVDTNGPSNVSVSQNSPGPGYEEPISTRSSTRFDDYNTSSPELGYRGSLDFKEIRENMRKYKKPRLLLENLNPSLFKPNLDIAGKRRAAREQFLDPISWEVDCMNRFSNEMFTKLAITEHGNESISPFGIHVVLLIMVTLGVHLDARNEINKILSSTTTTYLLNHSNAGAHKDIIVMKSTRDCDYFEMKSGVFVDPPFKINMENKYNAEYYLKARVQKLNFKEDPGAQRRLINDLTCPKTDQNISELFTEGSINANTETVLASSMNFKLAWERPFEMFHSSQFWNSGTTLVEVNMMYGNPTIDYYHDEELSYAAIMLPFHVIEYSMIIILPDDKDGLKRFDFTKIEVYELLETQFKSTSVHVHLPSFKIDQPMDFKEILSTKYKVKTMFEKGLQSEDRYARTNKFMHKTYVEVHSQGIGDSLDIHIGKPETNIMFTGEVDFNADHPFAYYIMYSFRGDKEDEENEEQKKEEPWMTSLILSGGVVTTIDAVKN